MYVTESSRNRCASACVLSSIAILRSNLRCFSMQAPCGDARHVSHNSDIKWMSLVNELPQRAQSASHCVGVIYHSLFPALNPDSQAAIATTASMMNWVTISVVKVMLATLCYGCRNRALVLASRALPRTPNFPGNSDVSALQALYRRQAPRPDREFRLSHNAMSSQPERGAVRFSIPANSPYGPSRAEVPDVSAVSANPVEISRAHTVRVGKIILACFRGYSKRNSVFKNRKRRYSGGPVLIYSAHD
jgi:hypothetical protein